MSGKFELVQHFKIESARYLPFLPESHPCRSTHGHSFKITLRLQGELDPKIGWMIDYNEISQKMQPLLKQIDHKLLNEVPGLENPTSENLAHWVYVKAHKVLPQIVQVIVAETPETECKYPVI
ncbi:MAG: 6-pyruvoyl trahydropterin synthase family protein [Pseudobdellovibrionaceae bacterium]